MSWPWLVLLVLAALLAVAVEKPRLERRFGAAARRDRERQRRKKQLRVVTPDDESEEFIRSVQRDLDALPTIEERDRQTSQRGRPSARLADGERRGQPARVREDARDVLGVLRLLEVGHAQAEPVRARARGRAVGIETTPPRIAASGRAVDRTRIDSGRRPSPCRSRRRQGLPARDASSSAAEASAA